MNYSDAFSSVCKKQFLILRILWAAFTFSIVIYGVIAFVLFSGNATPGAADPNLQMVCTAVGVLLAIASLSLGKLLLSDEQIRSLISKTPDLEKLATNRQTQQVDNGFLEQLKQLPEREQRLLSLSPLLLTMNILRLALNELIAILGIVLAITAQNPQLFIPFAGAALLLNLVQFPREQAVFERAELLLR